MRILQYIFGIPIAIAILVLVWGAIVVGGIFITHVLALIGMWIIAEPGRTFMAGMVAGGVLLYGYQRCNP